MRHVVPLISHFRSYPPLRSQLHPPSLSFSSTTLSSSQNTKLSQPSLSLHAMIMSWHWVQHTPSTTYIEHSKHRVQHTPCTVYTEYSIHHVQYTLSTAYTVYSIHRVQHTSSTASTQDCLSSLQSHDYELTRECSIDFWRASLHNGPPSASSPWEFKDKVTVSHFQVCESTTWWIESQHPAHRP